MNKSILDVTCGDRTIWFQKNEPHTIYCDKRREEWEGEFGNVLNRYGKKKKRHLVIDPDVQCDFTDLPFPDESFHLVVFDPPHIENLGQNAWMRKSYGSLDGDWRPMIRGGVQRVYACAETERSADIQMVRHIRFDARNPKRNRGRTVIRTSLW